MPGSSRLTARSLPADVCGHRFRDSTLLEAALTHPSATDPTQADVRLRFQRLEFLGDAVWNLCVSDALVALWPTASEGELSQRRAHLVNATALAEMARSYDLQALLLLSPGEDSAGGRERASILSSAFEAVIGAIYLDGGEEEIRRLARDASLKQLDTQEPAQDPKAALQALSQSRFRTTPRYRTLRRSGPMHAPVFEVEVRVGQSPIARGRGHNKQEAERAAALAALGAFVGSESTRSSDISG